MMKTLKRALLTGTTLAMLAACSTPAPTTVIGFNYVIDNARANGIVQVFDLSGNTVVHMRDMNRKTTRIFDAKNAPIPFRVVGENAVLAGMFSDFTVSSAVAASRVHRKTSPPAVSPGEVSAVATASTVAQTAAEPNVAIEAEIARMRKELAELKALLAAAGAVDNKPGAQTASLIATEPSTPAEQSVVIVSFPNNGRQFNPLQEQRAQLQAMSHTPGSITVRGFTDSEFATPGSTALAKARAESAKRYLMSMGVSAAKIVVGFDGARKFIAENRSPSGRAANRRVEIGGA
jgi:outer membrane protein OmpA-like peptidoglycan-associated protein